MNRNLDTRLTDKLKSMLSNVNIYDTPNKDIECYEVNYIGIENEEYVLNTFVEWIDTFCKNFMTNNIYTEVKYCKEKNEHNYIMTIQLWEK